MDTSELLHQLVLAASERTPDAPAVHAGDTTVTYRELDELAGRQAAGLHAAGVRRGDRVLIWAEKSVEVVALMQAALRLGAVYVPVAPSNPVSRVRLIAEGCTPALVVTDQVADWGANPPPLSSFTALSTSDTPPPPEHVGPDEPAYILYTSGSTGAPKGVLISHRNALAFVEWAAAETGLHAGDRLANHAPFNFDLSVFDLYGAFLAGASVDLAGSDLSYSPAELTDFLHGRGISVWYSVPSALLLMMRHGGLLDRPAPASLRVCVFAGEPFPIAGVQTLRRAWPDVRLFNWYGPTETNVVTSYEVTDADLSRTGGLPIGRACSGATLTLSPDGEIVVEGPTVMLGYWGAPPQLGGYHTGDVGRYDAAGELEYAGRRDAMVKIRGHRIELGEIETALSRHPAVAEVAVIVAGAGIDARLRAVIVPRPGERVTLLGMKAHCAAHLPRYMIVDEVSVVGELPRTANGKTDRAALAH
ncbi:amino acid adenylation domain-containing protein [Amycolatopsis mongoliensis]|uniref:Amino acid adenylation domain-containing protein n=1 Tax=Amycolatopsis mongoliensis TaxID=715475 RepID=A0A9Y2JPR2_9PSEU|nr:amino acid adenylation domain-containing protein [Amycolatopsis sp. 4-36]WIY01928.1 amino acid adenylation domain-containing protein [Amycolatopsis sp. 4-36]